MKYVPLEKRSKREQKEYHNKQRGSWLGVDPHQRIVPSRKLYDRNKWKREKRKADDVPQTGRIAGFLPLQVLCLDISNKIPKYSRD